MATPLTRAEWLDECAKLAKTYEEAMTDEAKALVESLRDMPVWPMEEAADRIEALEAENERLQERYNSLCNLSLEKIGSGAWEIVRLEIENERLRVALGKIARETTKVIPELINQQMCIDAVNAHARAALAGDSHDQ